MSGKLSADMQYALHLVGRGASKYEAAIKANVYPSSVYKAVKREANKKKARKALRK